MIRKKRPNIVIIKNVEYRLENYWKLLPCGRCDLLTVCKLSKDCLVNRFIDTGLNTILKEYDKTKITK